MRQRAYLRFLTPRGHLWRRALLREERVPRARAASRVRPDSRPDRLPFSRRPLADRRAPDFPAAFARFELRLLAGPRAAVDPRAVSVRGRINSAAGGHRRALLQFIYNESRLRFIARARLTGLGGGVSVSFYGDVLILKGIGVIWWGWRRF